MNEYYITHHLGVGRVQQFMFLEVLALAEGEAAVLTHEGSTRGRGRVQSRGGAGGWRGRPWAPLVGALDVLLEGREPREALVALRTSDVVHRSALRLGQRD